MQIVEFGHNPSQLFEKGHVGIEEKAAENSQFLLDPLCDSLAYSVTYYKQKENRGSPGIRIVGKDKQNLIVVSASHELTKRFLSNTKHKYNSVEQCVSMQSCFGIYSVEKETFTTDPASTFVLCENFLAACRNKTNRFVVYDPATLEPVSAVGFHKVVLCVK